MYPVHPDEIESIIHIYGQYVYNLSLKLSASPDKADELSQETFIKAWLHRSDLRDDSAIKKWLRTICINEFRMMLRKEKHGGTIHEESLEELEADGAMLVSPSPAAIDEVRTSEEVEKLRNGCFLAMTRRLTLNQRTVFSLIDMFGLSIHEVSELLNLTPKAVKGLLYRARMNLESFFQGHCSFLDIDNPCSCTAWIEFMQSRDLFQEKMRQAQEYLDYQKKGYVHNPETCRKILYFYHSMPEQRPSREWFDKVINLVRDNSV